MSGIGGLLSCASALAALALTPPAAAADTPLDTALREDVCVRRVHWPVLFDERAPGACAGLAPREVVLEEDGERRPVLAIDDPVRETLHALLIDNSAGMSRRLHAVRRAAKAYIDRLPDAERVLLASFSEDLRLLSAPTIDRSRLATLVEGIDVSATTALYDALIELVGYLGSLPGRKVLVVLSDGQDNASLYQRDVDRAVLEVARADDVTVFAIGIGIPDRGPVTAPTPKVTLDRVSRASGGRFFDLRDVHELPGTLDRIREELSRRRYLSYRPRDFGEGPKDRPAESDRRERRVRVACPSRPECSVTSARQSRRLELHPTLLASAQISTVGGRPEAGMASAVRWTPSRGWADDEARWGPAPMASVAVYEGPRRLVGDIPDIERGRGLLCEPGLLEREGRCRIQLDRAPVFTRRIVEAPLPRDASRLDDWSAPEALLERALAGQLADGGRGDGVARAAFLASGSAFFELRTPLASVLWREVPPLRSRALAKLEARCLRRAGGADLGAGERERVARACREIAADADPEDLAAELACWISDIRAADLALGLDLRWARRLLKRDPTPGLASPPDRRKAWSTLRRALAPASGVRVVLLLVPGYSSALDCVGFHRVLLPAPGWHGADPRPIPPAPLATLLVEALTDDARTAELLTGAQLVSARVAAPELRDISRADESGTIPAGRVSLTLADLDPGIGALEIDAEATSAPATGEVRFEGVDVRIVGAPSASGRERAEALRAVFEVAPPR